MDIRLPLQPSRSGRASSKAAALAVLATAQLVIALDYSIVNVALPDIGRSLGFTGGTVQWVISAYTLTFGGFLLLGGRAADLLGRRRMFMAALSLFGLASLAGGLAQHAGLLIAARAVQGIGGAVLFPATLSLVNTTFEEGRERNRAIAVWGSAGAGGLSLGVLAGGVLTGLAGGVLRERARDGGAGAAGPAGAAGARAGDLGPALRPARSAAGHAGRDGDRGQPGLGAHAGVDVGPHAGRGRHRPGPAGGVRGGRAALAIAADAAAAAADPDGPGRGAGHRRVHVLVRVAALLPDPVPPAGAGPGAAHGGAELPAAGAVGGGPHAGGRQAGRPRGDLQDAGGRHDLRRGRAGPVPAAARDPVAGHPAAGDDRGRARAGRGLHDHVRRRRHGRRPR